MRQLSGSDAMFLYQETRRQHQHTMKIVVLDPGTAPHAPDFATFKESFAKGVLTVPVFHWKLVRSPLRLSHPFWFWQARLDLDYHIRRIAAPSPGRTRELCEVISEVASIGLERDRPLWQMWWVEGLEGGRIALVVKLHHAVADGVSSAQILLDSCSESPDAQPAPAVPPPFPDEVPSRSLLLGLGIAAQIKLMLRLPRFLGMIAQGAWVKLQRRVQGRPGLTPPFQCDALRFNQRLTPQRWYANVSVQLREMQRVRKLLGGSLNDVFAALVSGALRDYLRSTGEMPGSSLTATMPVSIRTPEEQRTYGNRTSTWGVTLATHVEDPVERFLSIMASTRAARDEREAKHPEFYATMQDYWALHNLFANRLGRWVHRLTGRPGYNLILSNVRGPGRPMYAGGMRISSLMSMGPLIHNTGLNVTGWSYDGVMSVGLVACREQVPDLWDLAERIPAALQELLLAAEKHAAREEGGRA